MLRNRYQNLKPNYKPQLHSSDSAHYLTPFYVDVPSRQDFVVANSIPLDLNIKDFSYFKKRIENYFYGSVFNKLG
jgi:hypothetical protein